MGPPAEFVNTSFAFWATLIIPKDAFHRNAVLGTVIPTAFILASVFVAITRQIPRPKPIQRFIATISVPFRNFLTPEEVMDPTYQPAMRSFKARTRALSAVALIASAGWLSCFMYALAVKDVESSLRGFVAFLCWSYVSFMIVLRPPTTPPYLFIGFATSHSISHLLELGLNMVGQNSSSTLELNVIGIMISGLFLWIAGAYPLQAVVIAANVAGPKDVRLSSFESNCFLAVLDLTQQQPSVTLTCPEDSASLWSWCTFSFVEPILDLALQRTLDERDVWTLSPYFQHRNIFNKFLEYRSL
ncbi:hypothetical protein H0H93_011427 [Arthromyces matolae]|nr:hypothetical protein H0H93_011427 [Arthromyces matolae]